jgi:hypothetical protein
VGLEPTTTRSGPCTLPTKIGGLLAVLDVGIMIYDSRCGAIEGTGKVNCNRGRMRPRRSTHCRSRTGGKCGGRRHGAPERPRFAYVVSAIDTCRSQEPPVRSMSVKTSMTCQNSRRAFAGNSVITISNTTCGKLPKVISPSEAFQFEACHCGDSDKP